MPNNHSEFTNDWTLMFFFASDNPLAPLLVSQLKAIKDAGYQEHTDVLVYFDPVEKGSPTKIYNVNRNRKAYALAKSKEDSSYPTSAVGDSNDSYIRKMKGDEVDSENFSAEMKEAMANPSLTPSHQMLDHFVDYGMKHHEAKNYMLFLCGHGMIVGRDMFLPDEDPISAITMEQLQTVMSRFKQSDTTSLQLLALHSCSMSSLEVAYQLKGTANYLMAHQGPAFANSWPYRQLLKKILNTIEREKRHRREPAPEGEDQEQDEVRAQLEQEAKNREFNERLVEKLYYHCLYNATDFLTAGYSADLSLCSLEVDKLSRIKTPLQDLVRELKKGLYPKSPIMDLILLAHWEAQSCWEENYTDLYDFCLCLGRKCEVMEETLAAVNAKEGDLSTDLKNMKAACGEVIRVLSVIKSKKRSERFDGLVIHADNFGTKYHYARGLSVYFPWCEPLDDEGPMPPSQPNDPPRPKTNERNQTITNRYMSYDFTTEFGENSWWSFLEKYFKETKRESRWDIPEERFSDSLNEINASLRETAANEFNVDGSLSSRTPETGTRTPETGAYCTCPTIKNYPTTFDKKHPHRRIKEFSITPGALRAFRPEKMDVPAEPVDEPDSDDE